MVTKFVKYGKINVAVSSDETLAVFFSNGMKRRVMVGRGSNQSIYSMLDEVLGQGLRTSVKSVGVTVKNTTSVEYDEDKTQLVA